MAPSKDRISYFYDADVGTSYYGNNHPMKPHRLAMTHHLVLSYDLHKHLEVYRPRKSYPVEMSQFHAEDYVDFLSKITPDTQQDHLAQMQRFNLGEDCPIFDGLFDFCKTYTGGSIDGAVRLNTGLSDIAVNWSGGLHHAKKAEASGFCYINDLVLAILELLKHHARVVYIDIDIHHGDGVEEAFYLTDRVMTVRCVFPVFNAFRLPVYSPYLTSTHPKEVHYCFHKFGDMFFPGTGGLDQVGGAAGKYYSVNVPLHDGMDDDAFRGMFKTTMTQVMDVYQPGAVVLQCGADSLAADRLGCFNLSLDGHADCVKFMKTFKVPLLVTGGGGYTKSNVARCWTYETAALLEIELDENIPEHDFYYEYYADVEYKMKVVPTNYIENLNTKSYLAEIQKKVTENLRHLEHAPSVHMHEVPPDSMIPEFDEDDLNCDERNGGVTGGDRQIARHDEFYDGDADQDR